jgi:glycosyltransferase involved in cell wall biosynthesis
MLTPMPLRVALLTPFAAPSVRGNAVTVARISAGLEERGVDVRVWDLSVVPEHVIEREVDAFAPSVVHAFHAYRVGPLALRLARRAELPLVVTLTGTDANHDLFDPERASHVRRVLEAAARITVFHESIGARVASALPDLGHRLVTVPQSARSERREHVDLDARAALPAGRILFLFPAGIRMVKAPLRPLAPFDALVQRCPDVRLLYAGPILAADEGDRLLRALEGRRWASHIGAVPHAQMASVLAQADVVLNCSISEGGMANSVLEALVMERAVLASDIEGNRSLVEDGLTGLLFRDDAELLDGAERLARDRELRTRLGRAGRERVERLYPPAREVEAYVALYDLLAITRETA